MSRTIVMGVLLWACALEGCAFFGKSEPLAPHYYSADSGDTDAQQTARQDEALALRLGAVLAAGHLHQRIAYRRSERELGFYQDRRWTERPEAYLERALVRALFREGGAAQVVSGPAPTLAVELLEFVEVREPRRAARIRVRAILSDGRLVTLERTFSAQEAVTGDDDEFETFAAAMASAIQRVSEEVAEATLDALRRMERPAADSIAAPADEGAPET